MEEVCAYIHWAYILLGEVNNKKIHKSKLRFKKRTIGGIIEGNRETYFRGTVTKGVSDSKSQAFNRGRSIQVKEIASSEGLEVRMGWACSKEAKKADDLEENDYW